MQVTMISGNQAEKVVWKGVLTQEMSLDLGSEILHSLQECDAVTVSLGGVESLEVSCLVLLCTINRHAHDSGKVLRLEGLDNPAVAPLIRQHRNKGNRLCKKHCGDYCPFE